MSCATVSVSTGVRALYAVQRALVAQGTHVADGVDYGIALLEPPELVAANSEARLCSPCRAGRTNDSRIVAIRAKRGQERVGRGLLAVGDRVVERQCIAGDHVADMQLVLYLRQPDRRREHSPGRVWAG